LQVATDLGDIVVPLVAPVDRSLGLRRRELVVDAVDEVLPAEPDAVLRLSDELRGLVDDQAAVGPISVAKKKGVSRVARVEEHLGEGAAA
jgi:hypothetical protein